MGPPINFEVRFFFVLHDLTHLNHFTVGSTIIIEIIYTECPKMQSNMFVKKS